MLTIGIYYEKGFTASLLAPSKDAQKCADVLAIHNGNGMPDEILLVENDHVIGHFNIGKEYWDTTAVEDIGE